MSGWVVVHVGPIWDVQLEQGRLVAEGLLTYVPDASTKTVHPFYTGATPLMAELRVPQDQLDSAQAILKLHWEAGTPAPSPFYDAVFGEIEGESGDEEDASSPDEADDNEAAQHEEAQYEEAVFDSDDDFEPALDRLEWLGRRTRWASLFSLFFPLALYIGVHYLRASNRHGLQSSSHRLTVAAIACGVIHAVFFVTLWLRGMYVVSPLAF